MAYFPAGRASGFRLAATALLSAASAGALAQNADALRQFAPVIVEGEGVEAAPAWETRSSRERLDDLQIQDWTDLGRRAEPGVSFNRQNHSINIRGLDQDRVLTRVDGIRLPWLDDGVREVKGGLEAVDFNSLARLDVARGADASGGGSGAFGGVVNMYTLDPSDLLRGGRDFGAQARAGHDSADTGWTGSAALAGRIRSNTLWLVLARQRESHERDNRGEVGGYGPDRDKPDPTNHRQRSFLLKLQQRFEGGHRVGLTGEFFKRNTDIDSRSDQGPGTKYELGEKRNRKQTQRQRVSFDYSYQAPAAGGLVDTASVLVYWQRQHLVHSADGLRSVDRRAYLKPGDPIGYGFPNGPYGRRNSTWLAQFGASAEATARIAHDAVAQLWTLGAEWRSSQSSQNSSGYDNCPTMLPDLPRRYGPRSCELLHTNQADRPRSRGRQWAVWAQDEFSFVDGRYTILAALRYDGYEQRPLSTTDYQRNPVAAPLPPNNRGGRLSPKLLATWKAARHLRFYAQYAHGFKAPNATQLFISYGGPESVLRASNPYLKPETSRGWELGARLGSDALGASLSWFDNRYRDFIDASAVVTPGSALWKPEWAGAFPWGIYATQNRARVRIYGADASAHWQFAPGWRAWGSLAWAVGKETDTGTLLPSVAPLKAVLGVGYRRDAWGLEALLTAVLRAKQPAVRRARPRQPPPPVFYAPGYGVADLTAYWRPGAVKGLLLRAGVFNLFDKKYWDALTVQSPGAPWMSSRPIDWQTESGRSARVSLIYQY